MHISFISTVVVVAVVSVYAFVSNTCKTTAVVVCYFFATCGRTNIHAPSRAVIA